MKVTRIIALLILCLAMVGCKQQQSTILGSAPATAGAPIAIAQLKPVSAMQTIQGTMIEKCPVAGCWFRVKDATGVMKVDTKNAGFVVVNVPLNTGVTVTGRMASSGEPLFEAAGMAY